MPLPFSSDKKTLAELLLSTTHHISKKARTGKENGNKVLSCHGRNPIPHD
jgi:hypothetical protein